MRTIYRKIIMIFKLMSESMIFAFESLRGDKFRAFLSLFGVSIGIFSIVTVFTAIDALKGNVAEGLNKFGSEAVFIETYPMAPEEGDTEYKWWEYMSRPDIKYEQYTFLKNNAKYPEAIAFISSSNLSAKYKRNSIGSTSIVAHTFEFDKVYSIEVEHGRYFSLFETQSSVPVAILGYSVAETLFQGEEAVGKTVKIGAGNVKVIGVLKREGDSMASMGFDKDNTVFIPYSFAGNLFNVKANGFITVVPKAGSDRDEFMQELHQLMRSIRRLKPQQKDNFAINEISFILNMVNEIFSGIAMAGWIIGGFSILIGGFGIANIMFVSVKERTNLIGIQKALGAKKYVIQTQFLTEAAFLSLAGGVIGLLMVLFVVLIIGSNEQFPMHLSIYNMIRGLLISSVIGIVSGFIPARNAAGLNPVKAINSK